MSHAAVRLGEQPIVGQPGSPDDPEDRAMTPAPTDRHPARAIRALGALVAVVLGVTLGPTGPAAAAGRTPSLSISLSSTQIRNGEQIWIGARTYYGGRRVDLGKVAVQQRKAGSSTWTTVTWGSTNANGYFAKRLRPSGEHYYRLKFPGSGAYAARASASVRIDMTSGDRTNAARAKMIGSSRLGAATSGYTYLTAAQRKATRLSGVTRAYYRHFGKGLLVTVDRGQLRTWLVSGDILDAYKARGGPKGSLGLPLADPKCGLAEGGCVQKFSKGTVYDSSSRSKAVVTGNTGRQGELTAVARSQVGYKVNQSDGVNRSKYNAWMGNDRAWCSFLLSWVSRASGNGGTIPKISTFASFERYMRTHFSTGHTPRVGAVAFINTYGDPSKPTHTAYVIGYSSTQVRIIHGNTTNQGRFPDGYRGVAESVYPRSRMLYYAYPKY
jgi:hypothetical protein